MTEFSVSDSTASHSQQRYLAMMRLSERHARGEARKKWEQSGIPMGPLDAFQQLVLLAGGSVVYEEGEPEVDLDDIAAALTLVLSARGDLDEMERALLDMARGRGLTWQQIAAHLGLGSAQAASQRHQRLLDRTTP